MAEDGFQGVNKWGCFEGSGRPPVARAARNSRMVPTTTKSGRNVMRSLFPSSSRVLLHIAAGRVRPRWRGLGGVVDRLGPGPLSGRQPSGAARSEIRLSLDPATGARDQTFRLIVRPDMWGRQARMRFSNVFGTKPVTFDGVYRRPAIGRRRARAGHQPAGDVRRQDASRSRRERRRGAIRSRCRSCAIQPRRPRRPQARGELPCRRRQRPDDLARQGAADLLRHRARRRLEGRARRTRRRSPTPRPPGSSSMRSR